LQNPEKKSCHSHLLSFEIITEQLQHITPRSIA
jgi:hypothetical protein